MTAAAKIEALQVLAAAVRFYYNSLRFKLNVIHYYVFDY